MTLVAELSKNKKPVKDNAVIWLLCQCLRIYSRFIFNSFSHNFFFLSFLFSFICLALEHVRDLLMNDLEKHQGKLFASILAFCNPEQGRGQFSLSLRDIAVNCLV